MAKGRQAFAGNDEAFYPDSARPRTASRSKGAASCWESLEYLRAFIRDRRVASIAPTSTRSIAGICRAFQPERAELVIEFGPGSGGFTEYLLRRLPPRARLVAVETNADFVRRLARRLDDPRLHVCHDSAENIAVIARMLGLGGADLVISGIPFSQFSAAARSRILFATEQVLRPGGILVIYQFLPQRFHPRNTLTPLLKRTFSAVEHSSQLWNVPPLCVYRARKLLNCHTSSSRGFGEAKLANMS
jgi:phospholipid N-methyltransferase